MNIHIYLKNISQPIVHMNAKNAYQKGSLYCIMIRNYQQEVVYKYPISSIFRTVETK